MGRILDAFQYIPPEVKKKAPLSDRSNRVDHSGTLFRRFKNSTTARVSTLLITGALAACGTTEQTPAPTNPPSASASRLDQPTTSPTTRPTETATNVTMQVPLDQWRFRVSEKDPNLPAELAQGARISSVTAVRDNGSVILQFDKSRVTSGDPTKDITVDEPKTKDLNDLKVAAIIDPSSLKDLEGRHFWIYGGRVEADGTVRYAFQNDTGTPCDSDLITLDCGSTYTSKNSGAVGEEKVSEKGKRRYFLVSAPSGLSDHIGQLADDRTTVPLEGLPEFTVIHDYFEVDRLAA